MPDARSHRGAHSEDAELFSKAAVPNLCHAVDDLRWLFDRGYALISAVKLVGDRYALTARQRTAVTRATCISSAQQARRAKELSVADLTGHTVWIDGYNLLTTIEAALAGGVILHCQDGCYRDMASMHGTWKRVEETQPALELVGRSLQGWQLKNCHWLLDSPVSNSGRLKGLIEDIAISQGWSWTVELVADPDRILCATSEIVITADSMILDKCQVWTNAARAIVSTEVPDAWRVDLKSSY
jgi:hypothetical protein